MSQGEDTGVCLVQMLKEQQQVCVATNVWAECRVGRSRAG